MCFGELEGVLWEASELELAVLVGSRAEGRAGVDSDWDIGVQWRAGLSFMEILGLTETLRRDLARVLGVTEDKIDLIDMSKAGLTMRALIAEEGVPLKGEEQLAWYHFLSRVWRELEDYEWEKSHAL